MRLRELYKICSNKVLEVDGMLEKICLCKDAKINENDRKGIERDYKSFCIQLCFDLEDIPYLQFSSEIYSDNINESIKELECLSQKMKCVILLYETMGYNNKESIGIDIKIPKIGSITDLKTYIDGLEFVFTKCPFLQSKSERLELRTVEHGSIWLVFTVVGVTVAVGSILLNNIAAFIDKCFVIRNHKLICESQRQCIEIMEVDQKEKEEMLKNINKVYKIMIKKTIKEFEECTGYQLQDGDEEGRAEQSFERMIKLLDQGLQIYSSINSPEEIKAVFAPLEMHYLDIQKGLKQIEEKADTDNE